MILGSTVVKKRNRPAWMRVHRCSLSSLETCQNISIRSPSHFDKPETISEWCAYPLVLWYSTHIYIYISYKYIYIYIYILHAK